MTDYYTHFCFRFEVSDAEKSWLQEEVKKREALEDDEALFGLEVSFREDNRVVIGDAEGQANLDGVISLIEDFQKHFKIQKPLGFEWACSANRPRLDAYGGGAVVIHKGRSKSLNTGDWLTDTLEKKGAKKK